ncbi:MAG: lycopene cyclase CruA [Pyrinomonadaceae bacterium]|jgi:lycopene cyclase CruA|nr:lycopene cyclase CruA [Pyrinomonadaceae bacterium]
MTSAPTTHVATKTTSAASSAPDLKYFRERYPLTVANFGALGEREQYLRRIWLTETRWRETMESQQRTAREAVVRGAPPAGLSVEGEFEVIYAGGVSGLLHAAVLASRFKRRVMVFDAGTVGREQSSGGGRTWNLCDEELGELERAGLLTKAEIEGAVLNRYRSGFVKFHDAASRVKTPPLWMENVLDVSVDADKLLALAAAKIRARAGEGSAVFERLRFVRAYVEADRVCVETEDTRGDEDKFGVGRTGGDGRRRLFAARLFVDATGVHSPVARQFGGGRAFTHVAPSVGTVARGFARGEGTDKVDFSVGEILVSTEDARDHRQLIWEGFAGSPARDEYATRLFFYDAVDSPADKSLLALFEHYFEGLPRYKRAGAQWRVGRPLFGYAPGVTRRGWPQTRPRAAEDRVMLAGDAAGVVSPLALSGACVRGLRRLTHLTDLALAADLLDARALSEINAPAPRVPQMSGLAEFLRPAPQGQPANVNETLNAVMAALHDLDVRVRRELFQDRMSFSALRSLLGRTAKLYPRIFQRVREHLGARGTFWWVANIAEAAFSERRARGSSGDDTGGGERAPAAEFARYVALYRKDQEAGAPD